MASTHRRRRRLPAALALLCISIVAVLGALLTTAIGSPAPSLSPLHPGEEGRGTGDRQSPASVAGSYAEAPQSPRLIIPVLGIHADLVPLRLKPDGAMEVPQNFSSAGWYTGGPFPGSPGPAVVVGHVDSTTGPAVFFRLHSLRPGDVIEVVRDRRVISFVVDRIEQYPKDLFPTEQVFGPTPISALRVVTCAGDFDRSQRSYRDNLVVFASLRQASVTADA